MLIARSLMFWLALAVCCFAQVEGDKDKYGGALPLVGTRTGWFHVEEIGGRWYFVTPEGHGFFSLGVTHAGECIRLDELGLFETRYGGSEERLAEFFLGKFEEWGYNSSGYGPLPAMESRIPYVATIWTEGPRSFSAGDRSRNSDIFDPAVQQRLRRTVREAAKRHVQNPYCLGYVFIDLPVWSAVPTRGASYVDYFRQLGPEAPGRKVLDEYFAGASSGAGGADDQAFLNRVAEAYYDCVVSELRATDPHHLILGDRLMALPDRTPDSILATASKYVDVVSFQPMGTQVPLRDYIDHVFRITGKPVLLADVNTMTSRPRRDQEDTAAYEKASGEHTLEYYLGAAGSLYCIGIHRCTVRDYRPWDTNFHRRGLLKADDAPYPILVDYTRRANREVYEKVYPAGAREAR